MKKLFVEQSQARKYYVVHGLFLTVPFLYFRVYGQKVSTMVPAVVLPKMDISHLVERWWREVGPGNIFPLIINPSVNSCQHPITIIHTIIITVSDLVVLQDNLKCVLRTKINAKGETVIAMVRDAGLQSLQKQLQASGYSCSSVTGVRYLNDYNCCPNTFYWA